MSKQLPRSSGPYFVTVPEQLLQQLQGQRRPAGGLWPPPVTQKLVSQLLCNEKPPEPPKHQHCPFPAVTVQPSVNLQFYQHSDDFQLTNLHLSFMTIDRRTVEGRAIKRTYLHHVNHSRLVSQPALVARHIMHLCLGGAFTACPFKTMVNRARRLTS